MKKLIYISILAILSVGCAHNEIVEKRFSPEKGGTAKWYPAPNIDTNNKHADEIVGKIKNFCGGSYIKLSERDAWETDGFLFNLKYQLVDFKCQESVKNESIEKKPSQ